MNPKLSNSNYSVTQLYLTSFPVENEEGGGEPRRAYTDDEYFYINFPHGVCGEIKITSTREWKFHGRNSENRVTSFDRRDDLLMNETKVSLSDRSFPVWQGHLHKTFSKEAFPFLHIVSMKINILFWVSVWKLILFDIYSYRVIK